MKKQLLTISMITLLFAGQSAMASSDNNFSSLDAEAINSLTSTVASQAEMPVASYMSQPATDDPFSLDYSHE
jgi:hypothetical protein